VLSTVDSGLTILIHDVTGDFLSVK